ncbi:DsbA family protein [Longimicrobium sp.]|uniref:DsbA family protein n=1 Tax=Longimicrobium sp. TaxID=2029185 RepID=UPI003B3A9F1C
MKIALSDLFTGVMAVCALAVTGLVVKNELAGPPPAAAAAPEVKFLSNWRSVSREGVVLGRPGAPVQIIEFSDFQCPFCARVQASLAEVRRRHPDDVAVVFRHFPLTAIHPHATKAAEASACAGDQGRFEPYADALFARQDEIGTASWDDFARAAGVPDLATFGECMRTGKHAATVRRDADAAARIGLRVTPTLIINGRGVAGMVTADELDEHVRAALRGAGTPTRAE